DPDGTITTFDALGAGTGPGQGTVTTSVDPINQAAAITGTYIDASNVYHGFVRTPDGTITSFDVSGAGTGPFQGSAPGGINPAGTIEGEYIDASYVLHGFVRDANGAITTFDAPGAGTGPGQGTENGNINPAGEIAASYIDSSDALHGYVL